MIINPRKKVEAGAGARAPGGAPPIAPVQNPSGGGGTGHPGRTGSGDAGAGAPRLERKGTVAVASGKEFMKQLQEAVATPLPPPAPSLPPRPRPLACRRRFEPAPRPAAPLAAPCACRARPACGPAYGRERGSRLKPRRNLGHVIT